ncbi:hypothetical protein DICPUDRAFT_87363 [Dictyostelium purpureum]|uniref:Uncharacterized protein n=1 Tax=Dictyostelium purpureum TaxID=5786 RepID=F0ZHK4_DICPU|nr:uncharacterized protein DICPUDRAFT_87363 [Dictyostelium purpureum]EGC36597.1 hypothetical protein DICPUDRAFT_87363 [Dictyostelium purpureum]|eukprot:XP_003286901.1 hypothetical protein DICPUDRAFT_87363 [Dictyostelium purpureum]
MLETELFLSSRVYKKENSNISYQCIINHQDDEKYVILELLPNQKTDGNGKELPNLEKRYVFASTDTEAYHSGQKDWYVSNTRELNKNAFRSPKCLGGGICTIDHQNKKIKTYGTSYGYGDPPLDILTDILNTCFPDYDLDINITSEVRELVKPKHNRY